jgi:hypothetical protein
VENGVENSHGDEDGGGEAAMHWSQEKGSRKILQTALRLSKLAECVEINEERL